MKSFNYAALFHLTRSMCISTPQKSSRHPCWVVTSIGINLALSALIFLCLWKRKQTGKQSAFWLTTWFTRELVRAEYAETEVSEENRHSLV